MSGLNAPFSSWLESQLRINRLSLRQLAERAGVNHSTISRKLRGRPPSLETAARIARALGQPEAAVAAIAGLEPAPSRASAAMDRVEQALRADPTLDERLVRRVMASYLTCRAEGALTVARITGRSTAPVARPIRALHETTRAPRLTIAPAPGGRGRVEPVRQPVSRAAG